MKKLLVLVTTVSLMLALGACGAPAPMPAPAPVAGGQQPAAAAAPSGDEQVTLSLWLTPQWRGVFDPSEDGADFDSFFIYAGERFRNEINPNVTLEVQVIPGEQRSEMLNIALQTNSLPDMFFDGSFTMLDFVHMGALAPLNDIISPESKNDIPEGIWDNVTINNQIFFYPFIHMPGTLVYNADMFREAGLDDFIGGRYDIITWTPDEFRFILETIRDNLPGIHPLAMFCMGFAGDTWNLSYLRMFGSTFFDDDLNIIINEERGVRALQFMLDLNRDGLTTPGVESLSSNDALAIFANEAAAVGITNSVLFNNALSDMEEGRAPTFDARLANTPGDPNPHTFTFVTGGMVFNTGNANTMELAKQFIQFMSGDPELVIASQNGMPVRESVIAQVGDRIPHLEAHAANARYLFNFHRGVPGYGELRNVLFPALQAAFTGEMTAQEALDTYARQGNAIIQEQRALSVVFD